MALLAAQAHTATIHAQTADIEAKLQAVEIKAARVVNRPDGSLIYPKEQQKQSSTNGYTLLQQLTLPNIRIDETAHTLSSIDNRGSIQLRINGIEAGKTEMTALDPKTIARIEFIDNPGVRYGEGIASVINIITHRHGDRGYTAGTDITHAVTTRSGSATAYGKWNTGMSELSLSYDFDYHDSRGNRRNETADYTLNDGTTYTISRNDKAARSRDFDNAVQLKYNLADSSRYVLQTSLNLSFSNTPGNYNRKAIADGADTYTATQHSTTRSTSPVVDIYYHRRIANSQSVTLNTVGTSIRTTARNSYDERTPYAYDVDGTTNSLMSEAIYENRLRDVTLSAGFNFKHKYTRNLYTGDASSAAPIRNNTLYTFTQATGNAGPLRYSAGIGFNHLHYRQQSHNYRYNLWRPKVSAVCPITKSLSISYDFELSSHVSQIAMISDATLRTNSMEWTRGNPDIRPNSVTEHTVKMMYNTHRMMSYLQGYYRMNHRPNMAHYERTADNKFIYTQTNQKQINALDIMAYANYQLIPTRLSVTAYGGLFRCFNYGDDYTHCYTSWNGTIAVNANLGKLTVSAYADSGWRFMEGETRAANGAATSIKASYNAGNWQIALIWQQPFNSNCQLFESQLCNKYIGKTTVINSTDAGNRLSVNMAWRIHKGRKYHSIQRKINQKDSETGIIH